MLTIRDYLFQIFNANRGRAFSMAELKQEVKFKVPLPNPNPNILPGLMTFIDKGIVRAVPMPMVKCPTHYTMPQMFENKGAQDYYQERLDFWKHREAVNLGKVEL